jgi:hypothetical protein
MCHVTDVEQTVIDNLDLAVAQKKRTLIFKMYRKQEKI